MYLHCLTGSGVHELFDCLQHMARGDVVDSAFDQQSISSTVFQLSVSPSQTLCRVTAHVWKKV